MLTKTFNSLDEIEKYYDEKSNTYIFKKDGDMIIDSVVFDFDLTTWADIHAFNIYAKNINAADIVACDINAKKIIAFDIDATDINVHDIKAGMIRCCDINADSILASDINASIINAKDIYSFNISAYSINAENINYYAVCVAYKDIKCKSIKGRRENAKHFVLDGKLEVKENE